MKKITLSIISVIVLSSSVIAGGNIAIPVNVPEVVEPIVNENAFYIGLGLSYMSLRDDLSDEEFSATGIMLQTGYQFNKYFAIEGRYTRDVSDVEYDHGNTINPDYDNYPTDFSNIAIYLKPMYPVKNFTLYALLGYGCTELTNIPLGGSGISADRAESGFQWGLGAAYEVTKNISVFVDYVRFYDDTGFDYRAQRADINSDAWTLGVSYKF
jgi:opacity protein-like surface antigen